MNTVHEYLAESDTDAIEEHRPDCCAPGRGAFLQIPTERPAQT
jgi:hypothetical protein